MARVRAAMPAIDAGLRAGHSLKTIHERLNQEGIQITYRCLVAYRSRINRGKSPRRTTTSKVEPYTSAGSSLTVTKSTETSPDGFDPAANFRKQMKNRTDWEYPSGPLDEKKLI
jgi:hypothetical protein